MAQSHRLSGAPKPALDTPAPLVDLDEFEAPSPTPAVGDRVEFVVGYHDTTVHLHEEIVGIRKGRVEAVWRVAARGKIK